MMNQFELNQIRSKLRRLDLDDQFVEKYIDKLIRNKEPFVTASKSIDRWDKKIQVNLFSKYSPAD
jgi:hypothetical protein